VPTACKDDAAATYPYLKSITPTDAQDVTDERT